MENKNNPHGIKVGDPVIHVSNPKIIMGVEDMSEDESETECSWLDVKGHKQADSFNTAVLRKAPDNTSLPPFIIR